MDLPSYSEVDFVNGKNISDNVNKSIEYSELQQKIVSTGNLLYTLDNSDSVNVNQNFPLDPEIRLQNIGKDINRSDIDVNSQLLNLDKPLNRDVTNNLKNIDYDTQILDPITFNVENTYLNNPPLNIKGLTKNRWYELVKDNPINNSLEPFERQGQNTVLNELDTFKPCY